MSEHARFTKAIQAVWGPNDQVTHTIGPLFGEPRAWLIGKIEGDSVLLARYDDYVAVIRHRSEDDGFVVIAEVYPADALTVEVVTRYSQSGLSGHRDVEQQWHFSVGGNTIVSLLRRQIYLNSDPPQLNEDEIQHLRVAGIAVSE